jgi:hypothetical protein
MMPYLGLYLKDLTFIEEGNRSFSGEGAVNYYKMRLLANVIVEIQHAQRNTFDFQRDISILEFLSNGLHVLDEDRIWNLSFQCEAKASASEENPSPSTLRPARTLVFPFRKREEEIITVNPIFGLTQRFQNKLTS